MIVAEGGACLPVPRIVFVHAVGVDQNILHQVKIMGEVTTIAAVVLGLAVAIASFIAAMSMRQ